MSRIVVKTDERLQEFIDAFWDDRVGFMQHIVGINPTKQQRDSLVEIDQNDFVAMKSGHGVGKTMIMAITIWHYIGTRPFPKIPCTAPSKHQLYRVLWAELAKVKRQMEKTTAGRLWASRFELTKERLFHKDHGEEWQAVAATASKENSEALAGIHADYVLRIKDESSGIPDEVHEVMEGATGFIETKEIMASNPTRLEGHFFRVFNDPKEIGTYKNLTFSCLGSLVSQGGRVPDAYPERIRRKYGEDSNMYAVRVLGDFPKADGDSYIPMHLASSAIFRDIGDQTKFKRVYGVDPSYFGEDEAVLARRFGEEFKEYRAWKNVNNWQLASRIAAEAKVDKPELIVVDVIGWGAGTADILEGWGYPVLRVNVSESPAVHPDRFEKQRDELWGLMRDWLEMGIGRLWDNGERELMGELTTPRYSITARGLLHIESKKDMKKRGKDSPNKADAHNLTFALPSYEYTIQRGPAEVQENWDEEREVVDAEAGY